LVQIGHAIIIGPVRLEILSGINDEIFFQRARDYLREFDDEQLTRDDYEGAAALCNRCTARGVASTPNDLLICTVALRLGLPIFTQDADFKRYAQVVPLALPSAEQIAKDIERSKKNGVS
jgi:predicted nucleic acid-binding protein